MTEKEALTRVKTGNFGGGYGFDLQMLVDAVGIIGETLKSGRISEVVRCKDCKYGEKINQVHGDDVMRLCHSSVFSSGKCVHLHDADWFCADGERRE